MSTMDDLMHLATLKRQATSLPGLQRYRTALYATTDQLTEPGAYALQAALILDAVVDRIAKDALQEGTGAHLSAETKPSEQWGQPRPIRGHRGAQSGVN